MTRTDRIRASDGEHVVMYYKWLFIKGRYLFHAPPVCTAYWNLEDWINYVTFLKRGDL